MKWDVQEMITCLAECQLNEKTAKDIVITGVSTDSRTIKRGNLFIPLIGERFDGHDFVYTAVKNGASVALWQKDKVVPDDLLIPAIKVPNTLTALQQLAKCYREKIDPIVVGITGSNGKTTTKDLTASVLSTKYSVHKTSGNLNNHIGVPLTLLTMPEDTQVAVIEMGMSNPGEIEILSKLAQPDIAVITNIGESHLEYLQTRKNVAKAKLEIIHGLNPKGLLILNGDEDLLRLLLDEKRNIFEIIWVGKESNNQVYPVEINRSEREDTHFIVNDQCSYVLPLLGTHNIINALMAIQVANRLDLTDQEIKIGLADPMMTGMRLEKMIAKNGSIILNDAYNASPTSMEASIHLLATFQEYKKVAVLGDMLELGEHAKAYHEKIGSICANAKLDLLITTGSYGKWIVEGATNSGMKEGMVYYFEELNQIPTFILQQSNADTIVLIKGSRGVHLEKVVKELI